LRCTPASPGENPDVQTIAQTFADLYSRRRAGLRNAPFRRADGTRIAGTEKG